MPDDAKTQATCKIICPKCGHTPHNQHDCIRCDCDHQCEFGVEPSPDVGPRSHEVDWAIESLQRRLKREAEQQPAPEPPPPLAAMRVDERTFPIQSERGAKGHPLRVPWSLAEKAYSVYSARYGRSQSLERLAERGGFGPSEMDEFTPGWRDECSEIKRLLADRAEMVRELARMREALTRIGAWPKRYGEDVDRINEMWAIARAALAPRSE